MTTKTAISIVGDSFGCGEWVPDKPGTNKISHLGIQEYLQQRGYVVKNFSTPGDSMDNILHQIVINNIIKETIIVFATDPLRNFVVDNKINQLYVKQNFSIAKLHKVLFLDWFRKLSTISRERKCNIILIGGHANLYDTKPIKNISICTKSWLGDILKQPVGDLSAIEPMALEVLMSIKPIKQDNQKVELIDIITQRSDRLNLLYNNNFFPDNGHPNRQAHEKLTQKIINLIG
tara:strand:+ start:3001 stop:3699 length:699 start_codon:yes stop_codon:yes gene_type:complete